MVIQLEQEMVNASEIKRPSMVGPVGTMVGVDGGNPTQRVATELPRQVNGQCTALSLQARTMEGETWRIPLELSHPPYQ